MLLVAVLIFLSTVFGGDEPVSANLAGLPDSSNDPYAPTTAPYPADTCESAWFEASSIANDDIQDPAQDLDTAIKTCRNITDWMSQAAKYPQLLLGRDPILVLSNRCLTGPTYAYICQ